MEHLLAHNLLAKQQHGFVKGRNCTTDLLEAIDLYSHALFEGKPVDVLYTDFAKAFDTVPHKRLL